MCGVYEWGGGGLFFVLVLFLVWGSVFLSGKEGSTFLRRGHHFFFLGGGGGVCFLSASRIVWIGALVKDGFPTKMQGFNPQPIQAINVAGNLKIFLPLKNTTFQFLG